MNEANFHLHPMELHGYLNVAYPYLISAHCTVTLSNNDLQKLIHSFIHSSHIHGHYSGDSNGH